MRVCDICKVKNVMYTPSAIVDDRGTWKTLELCPSCYHELQKREQEHRYLAYTETVKAITGEIPHKFHWWNMFGW